MNNGWIFKLVRSKIQSFPVEQRSLAHRRYLQALAEKHGVAAPDRWEMFEETQTALHACLKKSKALVPKTNACMFSFYLITTESN